MNPDTPYSLPDEVHFGSCETELDRDLKTAILESDYRISDTVSSVPLQEVSIRYDAEFYLH